jgi:hypothetical protein
MKKILFLIALLPTLLFSQQRVGKTYSEIFREYKDSSVTLNYLDTIPSLKIKLKSAVVFHFFNNDMVCVESKICVRDTSIVNKTRKSLNETGKQILNNDTWVVKLDGCDYLILVSYEGCIGNLGFVFGYQSVKN